MPSTLCSRLAALWHWRHSSASSLGATMCVIGHDISVETKPYWPLNSLLTERMPNSSDLSQLKLDQNALSSGPKVCGISNDIVTLSYGCLPWNTFIGQIFDLPSVGLPAKRLICTTWLGSSLSPSRVYCT